MLKINRKSFVEDNGECLLTILDENGVKYDENGVFYDGEHLTFEKFLETKVELVEFEN